MKVTVELNDYELNNIMNSIEDADKETPEVLAQIIIDRYFNVEYFAY